MDPKIQQDIYQLIQKKGEFKSETQRVLANVLEFFLTQLTVDLQNLRGKDEKIKPTDIDTALKNFCFSDDFLYKNKELINNYIKEQKSLKIKRLREAGFGATNEHAQLHQRIFDSPHQVYDRNQSNDMYINELDDVSDFDSS